MENERKELSKFRLDQAHQCLKSAKVLIEIEDYRGAANRSYYCIFHGIRSVLALSDVDFKKHSSVIAYFRKEFIKTGLFDVVLSDIITDLFQITYYDVPTYVPLITVGIRQNLLKTKSCGK